MPLPRYLGAFDLRRCAVPTELPAAAGGECLSCAACGSSSVLAVTTVTGEEHRCQFAGKPLH